MLSEGIWTILLTTRGNIAKNADLGRKLHILTIDKEHVQ